MPLPKPNTNESHEDWMDRCMADDTMTEEYDDNEQRYAVCESLWRQTKENKDTTMKKGFEIKAKSETEAEIFIYEDIGEGWFGGISPKKFSDELKKLGKGVDTLYVRINSAGGSVFDGVSIYNQLKRHSARKIVDIDGVAASIASLIAMSGDEIRIAKNAYMMIHKPWTMVMGDADELLKTAELLEKIEDTILQTYIDRSKADADVLKNMMKGETWLTAEEAIEHGLADQISDYEAIYGNYNLSRFSNIPERLKAIPSHHEASPDAEQQAIKPDAMEIIQSRLNELAEVVNTIADSLKTKQEYTAVVNGEDELVAEIEKPKLNKYKTKLQSYQVV